MSGPTWRCSACDTYNEAAARMCAVCDTSRSEAVPTTPKSASPESASSRRAVPKPGPPRKAAPKKTAPAKKAAGAKKAAAAKKTPSAGKPAPARKSPPSKTSAPAKKTPARKSPLDELDDALHSDSRFRSVESVPGLEWRCLNCSSEVSGRVRCDYCGMLWSAAAPTSILPDIGRGGGIDPTRRPPVRSSAGTYRTGTGARPRPGVRPGGGGPRSTEPPLRQPTNGEIAAGCGCILLIAAAVITGVVLLILNWSTVFSYVRGADDAKPSPTVSASGPCPGQLAELLPKGSGSGARLVAAYSRDGVADRYAFCRTKAGKLYYFFRAKASEPYVSPKPVEESKNGYLVRFPPNSFRFHDGEVIAYKDGKESWKEKLVPESSIG